ncbi:Dps family protein [Aquibacillus rhizosphaerae]|uniref:Dps family protein n=1 Tax=Aquibacillus rhizosphaerae TaxID=3051431 RepID=A0ABT7L4Y0_9BACI|nr:Dps family protein [Aquibacillus sp. LR5S19]MDL4840909.1 Dps family protein [Aquibacillus sp. LR5S19]
MTIKDYLNKQISDWNILYVKLQHYHWSVKGEQFFTLHAKFEELYNEAAGYIDEIAERVLALGGSPVASLREYLELASIQETPAIESSTEMVQEIVDDYTKMISVLKNGMELTESENDEITGDILLAIYSDLEKHVWMLTAYLGE